MGPHMHILGEAGQDGSVVAHGLPRCGCGGNYHVAARGRGADRRHLVGEEALHAVAGEGRLREQRGGSSVVLVACLLVLGGASDREGAIREAGEARVGCAEEWRGCAAQCTWTQGASSTPSGRSAKAA